MSEKAFHQFMNKEHNYYSEDLMITRYGRYINDEVQSLWIAWQASRAQAIDDVRVGLSAIGIFDGNVFDVIDRLKEKQ